MSGEGRWQTVGRKDQRRPPKSREERTAAGGVIEGLRESSTVFSRFSQQHEEREEAPQPIPHRAEPSTETRRKSSRRNKPTTERQRQSFDECVMELDNKALLSAVEEAQSKFFDSPQSCLKEILGYLQMQFADVEVEKDFVFNGRSPGYPLTELGSAAHETLLAAVGACPSLAQEGAFRNCVDCLLGEVRAELPSYGTRIMLQALMERNPSVCSEATQRVGLLLQSCLNKVPEALSLLWAGLPHPLSHPSISLRAWHQLCLPLLHSVSNVPRQVLMFAVQYSRSLLSHMNQEECVQLRAMLPPSVLRSLLTSPSLVSKRKQNTVRELSQLLEERVLAECPDGKCVGYFTAAIQCLAGTENTQLLVSFTSSCLLQSPGCLLAWEKLFPSHLDSSSLLLHHLHTLPSLPTHQPQHLVQTLQAISRKATAEQQELCKVLVERVGGRGRSGDGGKQKSSRAMQLVVLLVVVVYVYILGGMLVSVARKGPDSHLAVVQSVTSPLPGAMEHIWWGLSSICSLFLKPL